MLTAQIQSFVAFRVLITTGEISVGDTVWILPAGKVSTIKSIVTFDGEYQKASAPAAVTLTLSDQVDISRGDMIVKKDSLPNVSSRFRAKLVWMNEDALQTHREYYLKFNSKMTTGEFEEVQHRIDVNSFAEHKAGKLELNEIGEVDVRITEKVMFDDYQSNPKTGAFIVIDRINNMTVGAGMIEQALSDSVEVEGKTREYGEFELELNALIRKYFPHWEAEKFAEVILPI